MDGSGESVELLSCSLIVSSDIFEIIFPVKELFNKESLAYSSASAYGYKLRFIRVKCFLEFRAFSLSRYELSNHKFIFCAKIAIRIGADKLYARKNTIVTQMLLNVVFFRVNTTCHNTSSQ